MSPRTLLILSALAILFSSVPFGWSVRAQDDEEEAAPTEAPAEPTGPPMASGRTDVTAVVGTRGMTFELRSHAQVFIPAGLPTGAGRSITFAEVRTRVDNATVAPGFNRLGALMSFNGALNATSNPVVISIRQPSNPLRDDRRVVLAMEQPSICREGLPPLEGAGGLCSGWELIDARYADGRLSASMTTPGGHRLMFGWVPRASE